MALEMDQGPFGFPYFSPGSPEFFISRPTITTPLTNLAVQRDHPLETGFVEIPEEVSFL